MLLIVLKIYVLLMFQFLLIVISMVLQSIFLIKTFSFYNSSRLSYEVRKHQKLNLLAPKGSSNSDNMNILSFFFIFLVSFNFLRKRKNNPHFEIILASIAFLVCILYRFSKPQNRLKSCFTCQFVTHDTIEITIEANNS